MATEYTNWEGLASTDWQDFEFTFTVPLDASLDLGSYFESGEVEFDQVVLTDDAITEGHDATAIDTDNTPTPWICGQEFTPGDNPEIDLWENVVYNGEFGELPAGDGWTGGGGWSFPRDADVARKVVDAGAGPWDLEQVEADMLTGVLVAGVLYRLTYTITDPAGAGAVDVTPYVGGTAGTQRLATGTFTEYLRAGTGGSLLFVSTAAGVQDLSAITLEAVDEVWRSDNLTIEAIVRIDDPATGTYQGIASNSGSSGDGDEQYLGVYRDYIRFGCVVGATSREVSATEMPALTTDKWYHVVAVREYDGANTALRIYVDGQLAGSGSWAGAPVVTAYNQPVIGQMGAAEIFDGVAADHVAFYASAWSAAQAAAAFDDAVIAMISGPSASQSLAVPVTDSRQLRLYAWSREYDAIVGGVPVVAIRTGAGVWQGVWAGVDSDSSTARQDVDETIPDGIVEVRMICKDTANGTVHFDDVRIDDLQIARAQVPAVMRDKFERLILASKPLHSWAAMLVDYV